MRLSNHSQPDKRQTRSRAWVAASVWASLLAFAAGVAVWSVVRKDRNAELETQRASAPSEVSPRAPEHVASPAARRRSPLPATRIMSDRPGEGPPSLPRRWERRGTRSGWGGSWAREGRAGQLRLQHLTISRWNQRVRSLVREHRVWRACHCACPVRGSGQMY